MEIYSLEKLQNVHSDLAVLVHKVAETIPLIVLAGYRTEEDQTRAYQSGHSKTPWPTSMHNKMPSCAVDLSPYPYTENPLDLCLFAGFTLAVADSLGLRIRYGGDWDQNWRVSDERFRDLYHFELQLFPVAVPKVMPV